MTEELIIQIITSLISVIAILGLVIKMVVDKKIQNSNHRKLNNPIDLHNFIIECTKSHQEQSILLKDIKENIDDIKRSLNHIEIRFK